MVTVKADLQSHAIIKIKYGTPLKFMAIILTQYEIEYEIFPV